MRSIVTAASLTMGMLFAGCNSDTGDYKELSDKDAKETAPVMGHDHEHGPHSGHILELSKGHGELVLEPGRELTLYLLGDDAKTASPTENASAKANIKIGEETKTYDLASMPQDGEEGGKTSRLRSAEALPETVKDLEDVAGEIVLTIGGESQTIVIEHDHHHD
jgi:hypothetical protein